MKKFMDKNFLLSTPAAEKLYHEYAAALPIIDYHCHISPMEIAQDRHFDNITQLWLGGDHYKWRQMRSNGIDEYYITGEADDRDKFQKWAETLEKAIGNPLYHWSHMELKKYFGFEGCLNSENAEKVWQLCNKRLAEPDMSVRNIIKMSNVKLICTTDDPVDTLEWHKAIARDDTFDVKVLPAWRPDKAMNIEKPDYAEYIKSLGVLTGITIDSFKNLVKALAVRMNFFEAMGCRVSDHALEYVMYEDCPQEQIENIFAKRLSGKEILRQEELKFKTAFMEAMADEYNKRNWAMQLHFGCIRDNNTVMYNLMGADTGYDAINNYSPAKELAAFLDSLRRNNRLPKTILYSLNPNDNEVIGAILGCFQDGSSVGKLQQGSAWWFNDHKKGMLEQMTSLANLGLLGNFIGMLTDSRSFLSYTRHEYFRRIMCNLIGEWVENGEYPEDYGALEKIVKDISYNNAVKYFGFNPD